MPEFSLSLKSGRGVLSGGHTSRVWLMISGEPKDCINIVEAWDVGIHEVSYVALPSGNDKCRFTDIVMIAPEPVFETHPRLVKCHQYESSPIWMPDSASLNATVLSQEWGWVLPYAFAYFCPVRGIIACSESDLRPLTDFVKAPPVQLTGDPVAVPGDPLSWDVSDVLPAIDTNTDILFADERMQGLGEGNFRKMPLSPEEKRARGMRVWLLNKLRQLTDTDEADNDTTWLGRVGKWADAKWREVSREQERELGRLLHLLKHDPDEALRFALPLNGGKAHRGAAPPSGKLTPRRVGFDVNRLGSSGPASPWVLEWQRYQELSDQYRRTANKALKSGRHRRAAYIFAELLRDYRQAAHALRQGGYYREAAVLYQTHLSDALEAAACLREGGHLREAIFIYEKKRKLETVAELYEALGEREESRNYYEQASAIHQSQGNLLAAAHLMEIPLGSPERAIELLAGAWPRHIQASACLNEELRLRLQYGSSDEIVDRVDVICRSASGGLATKLSPVLGRLMARIPDRALREKAANSAWDLVGDYLSVPNRTNERPVLDLLPRLAEGDPLLAADVRRFELDSARQKKRGLLRQGGRVFQLLHSQALPAQATWKQVASRGVYGFAAIGERTDGELIAMRGDWDGNFQLCPLPGVRVGKNRFRLLACGESAPEILTLAGLPSEMSVSFPVDEEFKVPGVINTPGWYRQEKAMGMAYAAGGVGWLVRQHHDELVLNSHSLMGDLIATHSLAAVHTADTLPAIPLPMTAVWGQVLIGLGSDLIRFHRDRIDARVMPISIDQIIANEHTIEPRFAVLGANGVVVNTLSEEWRFGEVLPMDTGQSAMTFTVGGQLLTAGPGRLEVWNIGPDGNGEPITHEEFDGGVPLAIQSAGAHDTFAVITKERCFIFRVGLRRKEAE